LKTRKLIFAIILALACSAAITGCGAQKDKVATVTLKSVNISDVYTLHNNKVKIGSLTAIYYDSAQEKEMKQGITDYRFFINGDQVKVDKDGVLLKKLEKGQYNFRVEWTDGNGAPRHYETSVRVKAPGTWAKYPHLVGKTYTEIKKEYGGIVAKDFYYDEGSNLYRIKGLKIWVSFGGLTEPKGSDKCYAAQGEIRHFFNNIKDQMTGTELEKLLDVKFDVSASEEAPGYQLFFAQKFRDGNRVFLYVNHGVVTPKTYITIMDPSD